MGHSRRPRLSKQSVQHVAEPRPAVSHEPPALPFLPFDLDHHGKLAQRDPGALGMAGNHLWQDQAVLRIIGATAVPSFLMSDRTTSSAPGRSVDTNVPHHASSARLGDGGARGARTGCAPSRSRPGHPIRSARSHGSTHVWAKASQPDASRYAIGAMIPSRIGADVTNASRPDR